MNTKLCIAAHRPLKAGTESMVAQVPIAAEPATSVDFQSALAQLGNKFGAWTVDAVYYESQEAF
jgi:hypothetical protein